MWRKVKSIKRKDSLVAIFIFLSLFIACSPVILSANYIRQDDMMWDLWSGMKISDFGYLYTNTVFELFRPICMLSFYLTDLISNDVTHAVYVRFISLILLGSLGVLLYNWQLKYRKDRVLSAAFAIGVFTLPPFQIFAATANYILIIHALLFTFVGMYFWQKAYENLSNAKKYYFIGSLFFLASLLDYPLSSMYVWVFTTIIYLNSLTSTQQDTANRNFIKIISILSITLMGVYYLLCRLIHLIFHVNNAGHRATLLNIHIFLSNLKQVYDILPWHSLLWFWHTQPSFMQSPFPLICFLLICALAKYQTPRNIVKSVFILSLFFFLSYSPILAAPERQITFRYAITTMPILLYILFWSISVIFSTTKNYVLNNVLRATSISLLLGMAGISIFYANVMLADGVVGPHQKDFAYVEKILSDEMLPLLKQNKKVLIHAIACDQIPTPYAPNVPISFEYGMRVCQYQQQVIGVIIHSLKKMGYASNYNQHNEVTYKQNAIIVNNTPWGTLFTNSDDKIDKNLKNSISTKEQIITLDMRKMPLYEHLEFYKGLLKDKI